MTSESDEQVTELIRGLSFGSVADHYERYRLSYPDELVDSVVQYAGRPLRAALEIGAGTGKATRLFVSRGIQVTALEPDAEMAHVLERTTRGSLVEPVLTTFEEFEAARHFDLVYAAAAWDWADPASRWAHAVEMLVPGGVLALFDSEAELSDPDLFATVDEIEKQVLSDEDAGVFYSWSIEGMGAVDGLIDVVQTDLPRVVTMPVEDFVGRLATVSAYLMMSTPRALAPWTESARCCPTGSTSTPRCNSPWLGGPDSLSGELRSPCFMFASNDVRRSDRRPPIAMTARIRASCYGTPRRDICWGYGGMSGAVGGLSRFLVRCGLYGEGEHARRCRRRETPRSAPRRQKSPSA